MKKIKKWIYSLALLTGILVMGCGGDDNDTETHEAHGVLTATVSGTAFTSDASEAKAVLTKGFGGGSKFSFFVQGKDKTLKRMINFTVLSDVEHVPGTFSIKLNNSNQAYYYENIDAASETAWISPDATNLDTDFSHGTVTLTEITSTRAKGTFTFSARESGGSSGRSISNGSFDVPLTRQGF